MRQLEIKLPDLPFAAEDALNRLRINIRFVSSETRAIMVTSSVPNEGKSAVAIYLWKMLAESGSKVLFLDLDLRNTVILSRFSLQSDKDCLYGLEHYLSGMKDHKDIIYSTNYENAFMIPCANVLENPSNLFDDPNFSLLLGKLREDYRYIIIDTPPLIAVSDGVQIASKCDACLLVVRSGSTSKKLIGQAIRQIANADCPILGIVLNRVNMGSNQYKYGYGYGDAYGYGYRYGYGYGQKTNETKT